MTSDLDTPLHNKKAALVMKSKRDFALYYMTILIRRYVSYMGNMNNGGLTHFVINCLNIIRTYKHFSIHTLDVIIAPLLALLPTQNNCR